MPDLVETRRSDTNEGTRLHLCAEGMGGETECAGMDVGRDGEQDDGSRLSESGGDATGCV